MRLTPTQRRILAAIRGDQQTDSGATAGGIAWRAGLSESSALRAVQRLERRGLVENVNTGPSAGHSTWSTRWELTDAGMEAIR